jgi:hypothetical protein
MLDSICAIALKIVQPMVIESAWFILREVAEKGSAQMNAVLW